MKKSNYIKAAMLQGTLIATLFVIPSCGSDQQEDSIEVAEEQNDAKFNDDAMEEDAEFLVNASEVNLEGVLLGQLAQKNGKSTHVRALGKMMEDGHAKSQKNLVLLAKRKMVTIPSSPSDDSQDAYSELNNASGKDFDKAYADMMVEGHKEAIDMYSRASTDGDDTEIKNWATMELPELRKHLDHSIECQKQCAKN